MRILRLFILLLVLLPASVAFGEKPLIATAEWPPYMEEKAPGQGIVTEIVRAAWAASGVEADIAFYPWGRAYRLVERHQATATFSWFYSDHRAEKFLFSDTVLPVHHVFFYRKDKFPEGLSFKALADLTGYRLVAQKSSWQADELGKFGLDVSTTTSVEQQFQMLELGRADLLADTALVGKRMIKKLFPGKEDLFGMVEVEGEVKYLYLMFSTKRPDTYELREKFNRGLRDLKLNGTYDAILKKYGIN